MLAAMPATPLPASKAVNIPPERTRSASRRVAQRLVGLVALAVAVLFALPASAGSLHTSDDAGVFTPSQLATVRSHVQGDDFDVRLVTSSSYASKSDLGSYLHRLVTEPNIVVIGLDPVHRHVSVHFGTGTRIADSEFKAIESAGVSHFKDSDWTGGVVAIVDRAETAVGTGAGSSHRAPAGAATSQGTGIATPEASHGTGVAGILFWIVAIVGVLGVVGWLVSRRRTYDPPGGYGPPMGGGGPPIGGGGYGLPIGGGFGSPAPGPYYGGGGGGGSGLGTNIASAGLGGLIGYEIGKEVAESHHHHDDAGPRQYGGFVPGEPPPREDRGDSAEPGNYDAGGASDGWDDSRDDGGGDDGGGGSDGGGDSDF